MGYNNWLRANAQESRDLLKKNSVRLQAQLSVLDSVMLLEETSTARLERVSLAIIHVMTEIHLLVTLTEAET